MLRVTEPTKLILSSHLPNFNSQNTGSLRRRGIIFAIRLNSVANSFGITYVHRYQKDYRAEINKSLVAAVFFRPKLIFSL